MSYSKKKIKRLYLPKPKKNNKVEFGKYASRSFDWVYKNDLEYFKEIKNLYYKKYSIAKRLIYDKFVQKQAAIPSLLYYDQKQDIVDFIITNRKQGTHFSVIKDIVRSFYINISDLLLNECCEDAKNILKKEFEIEKDFLVDLHILRYEELFEAACNPDLDRVPIQYRDSIMAENYLNAVDILTQKEKALGLHTKTFKIQINNFLQSKQQKIAKSINVDKLSFRDQLNLLEIIESTKVSDVIISPIIASSQKESMVQNKIETQIEAPIRQAKQTDVVAENTNTQLGQQGKSLIDIKNTIRENLKKQVEEAFKKQKK